VRIRILLAISDLRGGGAEREFQLLARHLSRDRFEAHLCFWRPVFDYEAPPELPIHMLAKTRPWHLPRTVLGLRRLLDELEPQVVFSQLHYVNLVTGTALAAGRSRARWACRQVNDPRREMRGPFATWARLALRRADRALGCCDGVSRALVEHLRLDPARVSTLRNLVDLAQIEERSREPLPIERRAGSFAIVHAARLSAQKNQALLLHAVSRLSRAGRPVELWMLGAGPEEARLRRLAERLGLAERVRWLGFQANPHPFFRAADCFALSSDHEGLPNAVIESMALGTPVVSTRCPYGPEELIEDGVTGRLVPVGDVEALAAALGGLADDAGLLERLGRAARERTLADFETGRSCRAYEALFEELAALGPA
jgi:glycosyltransferase involved in cell wall biosynthesis